MSNVLGLADPAHRDPAGRGGLELLEAHADPGRGGGGHVGDDEPRSHGVGGDAELAKLDGQRFGEALHASLGGGVVHLAAVAERGTGGQVDDAAEALFHHVLLRCPAHQERAAQVHAKHHVPVVLGHLEQQVVPDDPGVVDQDHRRAEFRGDLAHRGRHLFGVAHVGAHRDGAPTGRGDRVHRRRAGTGVQVEDPDRHAVGGEPLGGGRADATGRARDNGDSR